MDHKKMFSLLLWIGTFCLGALSVYIMGRGDHVTELIVMMYALGLFCSLIIVFTLRELLDVQKQNVEINQEISKKLDKLG